MALTREAIVDAGLQILDEFGLADLTMRRLAAVLDVKAGALYWHFPNKQALLAGVADEILSGLDGEPSNGGRDEWLAAWAAGLRQVLLAHRDAAELVASVHAMGMGEIDPCREGRRLLVATGRSSDDADATMQAFWHFILGHVVEEQTQQQLASLGVVATPDPDRAQRHFDHGLALLLAGLAATP